jgi:glycosyltransferase involved in cell wall biosynthesis
MAPQRDNLLVSVIIPVYNAREDLTKCLDALRKTTYPSYNLIVVDDGSTDGSHEIAHKAGAQVLQMDRRSGPAAARNFGAHHAKGDILLFVDADVLVQPDTLDRVVEDFTNHPEIAAVFGSYDNSPYQRNFLSQYKNLLHHFVHQISNPDAVTFWAGCGAIRKEIFDQAGGFDAARYAVPSIEDIELGYRLKKGNHKILLDKNLQVTHLKRWTWGSLIRTDVFCRAIPWSRLMLQTRCPVTDLNLQSSQKISTALVALALLAVLLAFFRLEFLYCIPVFLFSILFLNFRFFRFLASRNGIPFTLRAFGVHFIYYTYSGLSYVYCWLRHRIETRA